MINPNYINDIVVVAQRVIRQTGAIATEASAQIASGTYRFEDWARTNKELFDTALTGWVDVADGGLPVVCGGLGSDGAELSDDVFIEPVDYARALSVKSSFAREGMRTVRIPDQLIRFEPRILGMYVDKFRVRVALPNLPSATYCGEVLLTPTTQTRMAEDTMKVIIDL